MSGCGSSRPVPAARRKASNQQTTWPSRPVRATRRANTGQGRAGQGRAGQASRAGQGWAGQGRAGQGRAGQGRAGQGNAGQGNAGQGGHGTWRTGQGRAGQGQVSLGLLLYCPNTHQEVANGSRFGVLNGLTSVLSEGVISVPVYREALPSLTVLSGRSAGGLGRSLERLCKWSAALSAV